MADKISIRFFDDREVRAIWDDENSKWWFSVLDIVGVLRDETDYAKNRNYWKYLKGKLKKKENPQLVSRATPLEAAFTQVFHKYLCERPKVFLFNVMDLFYCPSFLLLMLHAIAIPPDTKSSANHK